MPAQPPRAGRRLLMAEAAFCIYTARLMATVLPFRWLIPIFEKPARQPELSGTAREAEREAVRNAIMAVRRRSPLRNTCLHRAMAAQWMLRRRGVGTTLHYGATPKAGQPLLTHAWVQDGEVGVVGFHRAQIDQCVTLARYSAGKRETVAMTDFNEARGHHEHN